jgi:hypothetical protein
VRDNAKVREHGMVVATRLGKYLRHVEADITHKSVIIGYIWSLDVGWHEAWTVLEID